MKIPSYDDLTPSIPDVHPRDTLDLVTRFVAAVEEPVVRGRVAASAVAASALFAGLRGQPAQAGALAALARDFSPRIERHDDGSLMLDVSGLGRLLGDAAGIASELARAAAARGLTVRIALAPTYTAARLLTHVSRDSAVVVIGDAAAALAPLPLSVLEDARHAKLLDVLRRWGLRTVGELAALGADEIAARFGAAGVSVHRLARGIDPRPLVAEPDARRFIESIELEWPIEQLEPLAFVLARLLDPLALALERADKAAAAIRLELRLVDRMSHERVLQLPAPMRDARVLRTLLQLDLESHPPSAAIDVVAIEIDPAPARIVQFSLLERATPSPETLATLTARLHALVGEDRCGSPALVDSHRPDAFEMQGLEFDKGSASQGPLRARAPAGQAGDGNVARTEGIVLRRFRPPAAIRVSMERGRPAHIPVDRKGMPGGRVTQSAGPWRSSGAWWHGRDARWDRDEWDVALSDGSVCRIYRDRETGGWFMEGVVD